MSYNQDMKVIDVDRPDTWPEEIRQVVVSYVHRLDGSSDSTLARIFRRTNMSRQN